MKKSRRATPTDVAASTQESSSLHHFARGRWFPLLVFALVSLAYFGEFVVSDKIVYGVDVGSDYHLGKGTIAEKLGELDQPLWNHHLGGFPEASELRWRYFPTYVTYLFTTHHRHLGWRYVLSVFLAGWGTYLFLRTIRAKRLPAIWGGIAFMSAPTFLSFTLAGHHAKMMVIALFPFMCWALVRGMREGKIGFFLLLATLIGLGIYTPHLQLLYYALWGLGVLFLFQLYDLFKEGLQRPLLAIRTGLFAGAVLLGLGLGSEGLWPSYLHAKTQSKRAVSDDGQARPLEDRLEFARSWSLHPEEIASLVVPEFGGFYDPKGSDHYWGRNPFKLNSEYFGIVVILLAALFVPQIRRNRLALSMATVFLLALFYTMGPHTPLHLIVFHLVPGASVLRTPGMAAFLFAFPACVLAAMSLDRILSAAEDERANIIQKLKIVGGVLGGATLLLGLAPKWVTDTWTMLLYTDLTEPKLGTLATSLDWIGQGSILAALICLTVSGLLYWVLAKRSSAPVVIAILCAITVADGWRISKRFLKYEIPARQTDIRQENREAVQFLKQPEAPGRIYTIPGNKIFKQPGYHLFDVPAVAGFHDFTLRRYDQVLRELAPVESLLEARYLQGQKVQYSTADLLASIRPWLNLLAARYIVAPTAIDTEGFGFEKVLTSGSVSVLENETAMPWVYAVPSFQVVGQEQQILQLLRSGSVDLRSTVLLEEEPEARAATAQATSVEVQLVERNGHDGRFRFRVIADQPVWLVLSENYYPDWNAYVDGEQTQILRANYLWQAVAVAAGEHDVDFRFESAVLKWSRRATFASALLLLFGGGFVFLRFRSKAPTEAVA
jgi:hypothetical protein